MKKTILMLFIVILILPYGIYADSTSKKEERKKVIILLKDFPEDFTDAGISGDFNGWVIDEKYTLQEMDNDIYGITLYLPPGDYLYRIWIDFEKIKNMEKYKNHLLPTPEKFKEGAMGEIFAVLHVE